MIAITVPTAPPPAISVRGLVKRFGEIEAVRGVEFEVETGEVFGFLGPNGAGKTTTINMLCTLAKPTSGSAMVAGHDVVRERDGVRRNIGLVFQDPTLDGYLTAEQNLKLSLAGDLRPPSPHLHATLLELSGEGGPPLAREVPDAIASARRPTGPAAGRPPPSR